MNKPANLPKGPAPGYINLVRFLQVTRAHLRWTLGCTVLGALIAASFAFMLQPTWQAIGAVRAGIVGQGGPSVQHVEPPAHAAERMKMRVFQDNVVARLSFPAQERNSLEQLYRESLKIKLWQTGDVIELRVRAYSPDQARAWIEATAAQLIAEHEALAAPSVERLRSQLSENERSLSSARQVARGPGQGHRDAGQDQPGERFSESVYQLNMRIATDAEIRGLESQRMALLEASGPTRTYPTSLVGEIHVSDKPVSPRRALIFAAGILLRTAGRYLCRLFPRRTCACRSEYRIDERG